MDELRAALLKHYEITSVDQDGEDVEWDAEPAIRILDTFAAAHPNLVDANATYCVNEMFLQIPTGATVGKIEAHINGRHLVEVVRCGECPWARWQTITVLGRSLAFRECQNPKSVCYFKRVEDDWYCPCGERKPA